MSTSTSVSKLTYQFSSLTYLAEMITMIIKIDIVSVCYCFKMFLIRVAFWQKELYVVHLLLKSRACSHFVRLDLIALIDEDEN